MADEHKQQVAVFTEAIETRLSLGRRTRDLDDTNLRVEVAKLHAMLHIADKLEALTQAIHEAAR